MAEHLVAGAVELGRRDTIGRQRGQRGLAAELRIDQRTQALHMLQRTRRRAAGRLGLRGCRAGQFDQQPAQGAVDGLRPPAVVAVEVGQQRAVLAAVTASPCSGQARRLSTA